MLLPVKYFPWSMTGQAQLLLCVYVIINLGISSWIAFGITSFWITTAFTTYLSQIKKKGSPMGRETWPGRRARWIGKRQVFFLSHNDLQQPQINKQVCSFKDKNKWKWNLTSPWKGMGLNSSLVIEYVICAINCTTYGAGGEENNCE